MRFWDASALVPLLLDEPTAGHMRGLLERDSDVAAWWGTEIECWSAIVRAARAGRIDVDLENRSAAVLDALRSSWFEIMPTDGIKHQARRLLRVHPLRSADALQLAAALAWAAPNGEGEFVCLDARLREAARLEGFSVVSFHRA